MAREPDLIRSRSPTCTPGPAGPLLPAVHEGDVFVAVYGPPQGATLLGTARIVGLNARGKALTSFPARIGATGDEVAWLDTAPDGRIWALLWTDVPESGLASTLVPLTPAP